MNKTLVRDFTLQLATADVSPLVTPVLLPTRCVCLQLIMQRKTYSFDKLNIQRICQLDEPRKLFEGKKRTFDLVKQGCLTIILTFNDLQHWKYRLIVHKAAIQTGQHSFSDLFQYLLGFYGLCLLNQLTKGTKLILTDEKNHEFKR